ncbi:hypothetical protein BJX96DRAFT_167312 [Aspergillus floccosus]
MAGERRQRGGKRIAGRIRGIEPRVPGLSGKEAARSGEADTPEVDVTEASAGDSPVCEVAGGVNRLLTLWVVGGWELDGVGYLTDAAALPRKLGAGSSKLGSDGAADRRVFNGGGGGFKASRAVPMPGGGGGTARAARLAAVSREKPSGCGKRSTAWWRWLESGERHDLSERACALESGKASGELEKKRV